MSLCASCGQKVRWIKTVNDKNMPCDPKPIFIKAGATPFNATIVTEDGRVIKGRKMEPGMEEPYTLGYISHFATCPEANKHRRRK